MKKMLLLVSALLTLAISDASAFSKKQDAKNNTQDIQIFTAPAGKITSKTIDAAFESLGFIVDGNNDMNKPFNLRFHKQYYNTYRLMITHHPKSVLELVKKHPGAGLLSPLSMSIYSDDTANTLSMATLTLHGMSRITQIPENDKDLIAYYNLLNDALSKALPGGKFQTLDVKTLSKAKLATTFTTEFEVEEGEDIVEAKESFQAEFEGELEPIGFLFPGFIDLNDEFTTAGYEAYDFYDTYSICKFDVIFPVSKNHPEAGAFAPCTFYMYKKKDEETVHMGFASVENWVTASDIQEQEALKPLRAAQKMIEDVVNELIE